MAELKGTLIKRSDKVAYYGVKDGSTETFTRMQGFTSFGQSKNPVEYSRRYVDEAFEQTDVTGYSTSIGFNFDQYKGNAVHDDLAQMCDNEVIGTDAVRNIVLVDFSKPIGGATGSYSAIKRAFAVIYDTDGDSTDAYTYSGNFKTKGSSIAGTAVVSADELTIEFTPDTEE